MLIKQTRIKDAGGFRKLPRHVAFILAQNDDSGASCEGGKSGEPGESEQFPKNLIETAARLGIGFLTFCLPRNNIEGQQSGLSIDLKPLFARLAADRNWLQNQNINVHIAGESVGAPHAENNKLNVSLISQIDGRTAILAAVQNILKKVEHQELGSSAITSQMMGEHISPIDLPDADLMIFTNGLKRLENGLIWRSAYSEFAFVDERWENLTANHFLRIVEDYMGRDRRFGGLTILSAPGFKTG